MVDTDPYVGPWAVEVEDGQVVVRHKGDPQQLATFVRHIIHAAQATEGLRRAALMEGLLPRPRRGDIDPAVARLREIRENQGIYARQLRDVLRYRVDGYERGETQPPIGNVRTWAWLLGHDLTLTPRQPAGGATTPDDASDEAGSEHLEGAA